MTISMRKLPLFVTQRDLKWKGIIILLTAAMSIAPAGLALAADCRLQASNTHVDYGALYRGELLSGGRYASLPLGKREFVLTATCGEMGPFALQFSGEPAGPHGYRFGNRGEFALRVTGATVDGQKTELARNSANGTLTPAADSALLQPGTVVAPVVHGRPAAGRVFTVQVEVDTNIDEQATRVRDITMLEGHGTFELTRQ